MRYGLSIAGLFLLAAAGFSSSQIAIACGQPQSRSEDVAPIERCATSVAQIDDLAKLAHDAISDNADVAKTAIEALRKEGREGLEKFLSVHKEAIDQHLANKAVVPVATTEDSWTRIKAALDSIGGQYDCHASKLYWYSDFEQAKAAAKTSGKPILSLRMLGRLTDEFSCANSRFFRSTLYANKEVSDALRDRFVLHWQSVRPVPRVTIDFGDGRKLERTLTGNSAHYILDSSGRVIDCLPGLYGPKAFLRGIETAERQIATMKDMSEPQRFASLQSFHDSASKQAISDWQQDLAQLNLLPQPQTMRAELPPRAVAANKAAVSKGTIETRILVAALPDAGVLASATDDTAWGQIAALHQADAQLDDASIAFIRMQNPRAALAGALSESKARVEDPMVRLVRNFQNTIGIDTVKNEYTLHRQLHEWFASAAIPPSIDVNDLNERVYAQLFLTPSSDPWLGLMPGDVYTALDNNGVAQN